MRVAFFWTKKTFSAAVIQRWEREDRESERESERERERERESEREQRASRRETMARKERRRSFNVITKET